MYIQSIVVDKVTGEPLPGATLYIDETPIGVTDSRGHFAISTALQGENLIITYVGYDAAAFPIDQINTMLQIPMTLSDRASALPEVTVTPNRTITPVEVSNKPNILYPLLLAGGALFLLSSSNKRKRVSGSVNTNTLLIAGGAAVAVYLLTRPRTPAPIYQSPQVPVYNPAYLQSMQNPGVSSTAQDIAAGGSALKDILTAIQNF